MSVDDAFVPAARAAQAGQHYHNTGWRNQLSACLGPSTAAVFTNPLDVAKVQMQMQRKGAAGPQYRGMFDCLVQIARAQGVSGVQRGLSMALIREGSKCTFRLGLYQPALDIIHPRSLGRKASVLERLGAAGFAGGVSSLICNPVDIAKTRLQGNGGYVGVFDVFVRTSREEGWRALWKGTSISIVRSVLANCASLPTKTMLSEIVSDYGLQDQNHGGTFAQGMLISGVTGGIGGVAAVVAMNPADVIRTRLYNQPVDAAGKGLEYASTADCAVQIFRQEGAAAFYKGFAPHAVRTGPHYMLIFLFIDMYQSFFRSGKNEMLRRDWEAQKKAAFTEWQKKPVGGKAAPGLDLGDVEAAIRRLIPRSVMAMDQVDYDGFIKAQTKKVFEAVDVDQSGLVEEDEFLRLCEFLRDTAFQVQTKVVFDTIDADGSGYLDRAEIAMAMRKMPALPGTPPVEPVRTAATEARLAAAVDMIFAAHDVDRDGKIGLGEFRKFARKQQQDGDISAIRTAEDAIVALGKDAGIGSD